jgi:hypothetical protein
MQVVFVCLTVTFFLGRRQLGALYFRVFPTRKKLAFAFAGILLSVMFTLAGLEIACRILGLPFDDKKHWAPSENALAQFDPELGWSYIPNRTAVQEFGIARRPVAMHFDELGSRVRAPGVHHDPAAPSLLLVGDSYTFGHGLPYEETLAGQLESVPGFPLQVANLGVQGHGTDQALLLLKKRFKKFNTKAVMYTYLDEHIARNANHDRRIIYRDIRILGTEPLFVLGRDGTLYLQKKPVRYEDLGYSRLWATIQVIWSRWGPKPSVDLTRALVQEMKNYVESNGAIFIVVHWYQRDHWKWNPPSTLGPGELPFHGMNLNLIDTTSHPPPGWNTWLIPGDEHPDARAHAYVAQLVSERIEHLLGQQSSPEIR